jgi:DNA polymerase-1
MFAGLPKRLDFQASMYCDHYLYWKDDGKTWEKDVGEDQLWSYNCVDCVRTRESGEVELATIQSMGLAEVEAFQQKLFYPVLQAMQRGVRIDEKARSRFASELQDEMVKREEFFLSILGHPLNPGSPLKMKTLFYEDLGIKPVWSRAKKGIPAHVTCDDEALLTIMRREPITRPLIRAIQEYRSLGVFLRTFVLAGLDYDKRMRCSYNICGTETYRFSSSKNPFNSGTNLQNIPKGKDEDGLSLPNVRSLFIPDQGYTFFDMDLDRADLQVVVWESGEEELKAALRLGVDMHLLNAYTLAGRPLPDLAELVEGHPKYLDHRVPYKKERQLAKSFIHGTNYGGGARTMAVAAGVTVHQADRFQKIYFGRYPGLKAWHERVYQQLTHKRFVQNAFGYRRYYFDRTDGLLPEALAWIPQSTVANVINRAWVNIYEQAPEIQILLQVHDSLAGQFPSNLREASLKKLHDLSQIVIPYPDPLIIPTGVKVSDKSWGACE